MQWTVEYTFGSLYLSEAEQLERLESTLKTYMVIASLDKVSAEQWVTVGVECAAGVGKTIAQ